MSETRDLDFLGQATTEPDARPAAEEPSPTVGLPDDSRLAITEVATGGETPAPAPTTVFETGGGEADPFATVEQDRGLATTAVAPHGGAVGPGGTFGPVRPELATEAMSDIFPAPPPKARPRVGTVVPGYVILEEIARGGMGVVYKARQEKLGRLVALKRVLAGAHASPEQLERFATESQAVAQLQHPGIVQIHEVGEHEGLPYFSLEFVPGGSLAQRIAGKPRPTREAAETIRDIALALREAHVRNIIHRDLKPANILLTDDGRPKIADFGLAKRMDSDSDMTRTGAIMGTPSYMAPEQAWGKTHEIGPLSDLYALGAILYEMLVGHPPFQGATALETIQLARTEEPVPPTRLQPKIPADLETVCLKCLQKEPAKRYTDVAALADDLQRFLDGRPILARPVGSAERLVRWSRRNPKVAALAGTVAALLILGASVSTATALYLQRLNADLVKSNKAESAAKATAEAREREAVLARNTAVGQTKKAVEALRIYSVLVFLRLRDVKETRGLRQELNDRVEKALGEITEQMGRDGDVLRDPELTALANRTLAGIHQRNGMLMAEVGRFQDAMTHYRRMDALAHTMVADDPKSVLARTILAQSNATLGDLELNRIGDSKAALGHYEQNLAARREVLKLAPDEEAKRGVCNALGAVASLWLKLGDPKKARDYYREESDMRGQVGGEIARVVEFRRESAQLQEKLGDLEIALGDKEAGKALYLKSLKARETIAAENPDLSQPQRDLLLAYKKMGTSALLHLNDPALARSFYEKALAGFEANRKAEPQSLVAREDVAISEYMVATACLRAGDPSAADEHYRACLAIREALAKEPKYKINEIDLMIIRARCGHHEQASKAAEELIKTPPTDARDYFQYACGFALCAGAAGKAPPAPAREDLVKHYTARAVDALRLALAAGWKNASDVETDPDLDAIRQDPGFSAVLDQFRKASGG